MLPQPERLRDTHEFQAVFQRGQSYPDRLLVLNVWHHGRSGDRRIGFSVSKKVGNAVVRNRVKRRLREINRQHLPSLGKGFDLVWVARATTATVSYARLAESVEKLLRKAGLVTLTS